MTDVLSFDFAKSSPSLSAAMASLITLPPASSCITMLYKINYVSQVHHTENESTVMVISELHQYVLVLFFLG